jgi:lipopolysaccharide/colanic/teichoic acid biosynthesis glycosyltransferase
MATNSLACPSDEQVVWGPRPGTGTPAEPVSPEGLYPALKAGVDFILALFLLVLSLPVLVLAGLLVKLTSRGPALYSQVRLGLGGRPYRIYKLRTMAHECEKHSGARWCMPGDNRVTALGQFLRQTHLDELPQLWNVLRGEMSLVGPRPERPEFVPALEQAVAHYRARLLVRPGITGLAQIQLPADTDLESVRRKLRYDLYYVRRLSFWLDVRLIVTTAFQALGVPTSVPCCLLRVPGRDAVEGVAKPAVLALTVVELPAETAPGAELAKA